MSILGFFLEESLFDMGLFQSDKVLTSRQVQLQFHVCHSALIDIIIF